LEVIETTSRGKKKTVLFLSPLPPPYMGPTIAARIILASGLKDEFCLIHLDTSDHRELQHLNEIDFRNIFLGIKHGAGLFWSIVTRRPDLVYIPVSQTIIGYFRDSLYIIVSKIFGRRVICHLRGGNFKNMYDSSSRLIRWYIRSVHSLVDGQIVLGKKLSKLFQGLIPPSKIYVVPNGKNGRWQYEKNGDTDKVRVVYLSNMIQAKGFLDVLDAVPEVCCKYGKRVEFVLAGAWPDEETKNNLGAFLNRNGSLPVSAVGPLYGRDKFDLLLSSDIFVFTPVQEEGHPWVVVEAMEAGLPVIATDRGAITESVLDGKNGFIVEPNNPSQIAEKIEYLIDNPEIRIRMGEESRRLYLENFTEDKMIERLAHAFHSIIGN
jgi:glycosyltransferase involved in cell wall biosynthesis